MNNLCIRLLDLYIRTDDLISKDGTIFSKDGTIFSQSIHNYIHIHKNKNNTWQMQGKSLETYEDGHMLINKLLEALIISFNQEQYLDEFFVAYEIAYPYFPNANDFDEFVEVAKHRQQQSTKPNQSYQEKKNIKEHNIIKNKLEDDDIEKKILHLLKIYETLENSANETEFPKIFTENYTEILSKFVDHRNIKKLVILAHCCTGLSQQDVKHLVSKIFIFISQPNATNMQILRMNSNAIDDIKKMVAPIIEFIDNYTLVRI